MDRIKPYWKALGAFAVAGTGALAVAGADNAITLGEALLALAAATANAGVVFGIPYAPTEGKHAA